ncbi:hypothetical protein K438DRAFT_1979333 [Mycena galopus ATCC 62051]|nr:hypothetical protein K438DRAFT_1993409 [Mycena galopus ATCC 62051]KAF8176206.1 hypothetical protein K438DRAFT_1979333 [Mycena galopus ATCC 62051]
MFFAKTYLALTVVLTLSSGIAGIPSSSLESTNTGRSPVGPPEIFYSGTGSAKWANGSSVAVGPEPKISSRALQERQAEISCYNVGTEIDDTLANSLLTTWCEAVVGTEVTGGTGTLYGRYNLGNGDSLLLAITADAGCAFTVDPLNGCTYNFQQPLNDCNTATSEKQAGGGVYTIPCSSWRIDPGTYFENGSDY